MSAETVIDLTPWQFRLAGRRLAQRRKALGLSQRELGIKVSYGQTAVSFAEQGGGRNGQQPSAGLLLTLASALGTDLDGLLAECARCHGGPPAGYRCMSCGEERAA